MAPKLSSQLIALNGYGFVVFGLIWSTAAYAGMDAPGRTLVDLLDWPLNGDPSLPSEEARWLGAIGAGLCLALGLMFARIVAPLIAINDMVVSQIARKGSLLALVVWLISDSAGSIVSGVPSNAVFNFIFFMLLAVPLFLVKIDGQRA